MRFSLKYLITLFIITKFDILLARGERREAKTLMIYNLRTWKGEDGALRHKVYISVFFCGLIIFY